MATRVQQVGQSSPAYVHGTAILQGPEERKKPITRMCAENGMEGKVRYPGSGYVVQWVGDASLDF
jgi:hypothetical protein